MKRRRAERKKEEEGGGEEEMPFAFCAFGGNARAKKLKAKSK